MLLIAGGPVSSQSTGSLPLTKGVPSLPQVDAQTHPMKADGPTIMRVITVSSVMETYYRPAIWPSCHNKIGVE